MTANELSVFIGQLGMLADAPAVQSARNLTVSAYLRLALGACLQPGVGLKRPALAGSALSMSSLSMKGTAMAALQAVRPLTP